MAWGKKWQLDIAKEQIKDEQLILSNLEDYYWDALDQVYGILVKLQDRIDNEGLTPSLLNQVKYQTALKDQISKIYSDMVGSVYNGVSDYLKQCYEDGILKSMYSLHSQGLDIVIPIDQNEIALMASKDEIMGFKLSQKLYIDTVQMAGMVKDEITRGIITNMSYADIARNLENRSKQSFNRTMRIARTEGHKVRMQSQMQAISKAKEKGADIVKQWDSTLDGRTRPTHRQLDGQVREIDGDFTVDGKKAPYPGGFGIASEDINCRCSMLEIPRWALDGSDEVTKYAKNPDGTQGLLQNQKEIDLWKSVNDFPIEKGNKYNQFKKAYTKKAKQIAQDPQPTLSEADKKKIKAYEDEIDEYKSKKAKIQDFIDKNIDLDKQYVGISNSPLTVEDWKLKKDFIKHKIEHYKDMMDIFSYDDKKYKKYEKLLDIADEFDTDGSFYWSFKNQINKAQDKIDDLLKQIEDVKNPKIYVKMTDSGGNINQNCTWKKLFDDRYDADKFYRPWSDKTTYSLGDTDGQMALYEYTAGSGFMNRPLSGYEDDWGRYNFKGLGQVDWNNERSIGKKSINNLTKLIQNTEPLQEGIVLRRGSDDSGLIGLFEGAGFDYDTIKKAYRDGSIKNFEGSVIKNHAFTSCGIADGAGFGGEVDYIIKCPSGTKMVYAEPQSYFGATISGHQMYTPGMSYSSVGSEAEMILQRGTSYRIDKITKSGRGYRVEMTVVDQDKF